MHSDAICDLWSPFHFLLQKWNFFSFFEMKCRPVPTGPIGAMPVTRTASSVLRLPPKQTWASLPMILTLWHRSLIVQYWFIHGNDSTVILQTNTGGPYDRCQSVISPSHIKGSVVSLSKKHYPHCSVLVCSRNGFEHDLHKQKLLVSHSN